MELLSLKSRGNLKYILFLILPFFFLSCKTNPTEISKLSNGYVEAWKRFYPSAAYSAGDKESAFRFEELSKDSVESWLNYNKDILSKLDSLSGDLSLGNRIDVRMLKRQTKLEIEKWGIDAVHENSAAFYSGIISGAMSYILGRKSLTPDETIEAVLKRLAGIRKMCSQGIQMLKDGRPSSTKRSVYVLRKSADFYEKNLPKIAEEWTEGGRLASFSKECKETASKIRSLIASIESKVIPNMTMEDSLGRKDYTRKLRIFTDTDLRPEQLEEIALIEIHNVRDKMVKVSSAYWKETYPNIPFPMVFRKLLAKAIEDMEKDHVDKQEDFFRVFVDLVNRAEAFVREKEIASLPEKQGVIVDISPEHFPWAAVGGTYTVGPFDPEANTILYLPSVPDNAPETIRSGFYRSFNNHFNTMIIAHEIFPGHHLQFKIASKNPRLVRSLFPDGLYVEGWATLCEVIALDAGWNGYNKLDRLAHLRKRLENATRAYISVQIHCNGWDKDRVTEFAVEKGLLAPQFATNLWYRVIDSAFQVTSYFLGFKKFSDLFEEEKKRLGDGFVIHDFSDKVLHEGAIPIDELPLVLKSEM